MMGDGYTGGDAIGIEAMRRQAYDLSKIGERVRDSERSLAVKVSRPPSGTSNGSVLTADDTQPGLVAWSAPTYATMRKSGAQSIPNTTDTQVTGWTTVEQTGITVATNTMTIVTAGRYQIMFHAQFASNAVGPRYAFIKINGTATGVYQTQTATAVGAGVSSDLNVPQVLTLAANDVITAWVSQASGGALNLSDARLTADRVR